MEKVKKYVTMRHVAESNQSELDFVLYDEFGVDTDNDQGLEVIEALKGHYMPEGYVINVDNLIGILSDLKAKGSTHVSMHHHGDHIGYDITGVSIVPSTEEEIEKQESARKRTKDIEKKMDELRGQYAKLGEELVELQKNW